MSLVVLHSPEIHDIKMESWLLHAVINTTCQGYHRQPSQEPYITTTLLHHGLHVSPKSYGQPINCCSWISPKCDSQSSCRQPVFLAFSPDFTTFWLNGGCIPSHSATFSQSMHQGSHSNFATMVLMFAITVLDVLNQWMDRTCWGSFRESLLPVEVLGGSPVEVVENRSLLLRHMVDHIGLEAQVSWMSCQNELKKVKFLKFIFVNKIGFVNINANVMYSPYDGRDWCDWMAWLVGCLAARIHAIFSVTISRHLFQVFHAEIPKLFFLLIFEILSLVFLIVPEAAEHEAMFMVVKSTNILNIKLSMWMT